MWEEKIVILSELAHILTKWLCSNCFVMNLTHKRKNELMKNQRANIRVSKQGMARGTLCIEETEEKEVKGRKVLI